MASETTYRIGDNDVAPGPLLAEILASAPEVAAFLSGCGRRDRTTMEFEVDGVTIEVDDWSRGGSWVSVSIELAKDTALDFMLSERGAEPAMLVYCGRDADRAYELDDAGQDGTTLAGALGTGVTLPAFLAPHADLRIVDGNYTPFDGDMHQTSLTLAEPGSGKVVAPADGGPDKSRDPVAAQQAAFAAAMAARGR
jgi:hypothetical protein